MFADTTQIILLLALGLILAVIIGIAVFFIKKYTRSRDEQFRRIAEESLRSKEKSSEDDAE